MTVGFEVKKLVTGQSPNCCDYDKRTPLHVAASKGGATKMEQLDRDPVPNDCTCTGQVEVIKVLIVTWTATKRKI